MIYRNIGPLDPCNLESSWANLLTGLTKNSQSNLDAFGGTGLLSQNWDIPNIHGGKQMCHKPKITLRLGHLFALSQHKRHKMKIHLQVGCAIDSDICCLAHDSVSPPLRAILFAERTLFPPKKVTWQSCVYILYMDLVQWVHEKKVCCHTEWRMASKTPLPWLPLCVQLLLRKTQQICLWVFTGWE